jgi:hypothetical protein
MAKKAVKKTPKKAATKKPVVKKDNLVKKEVKILTKLISFLVIFIASAILAWFIPRGTTFELIFFAIAVVTGIVAVALFLVLLGILVAKSKK